ncbi:MAG: acyltransferase [Candidatus Eremiobacteraeota bacterium]|nr:acyltransferase [Candidatus Eremiobacteraeota bacterium]MBC5801671.1 acyltransferase [Candidatus Eremiobacteraeota bacterium]MBC5824047.1 acyltransferase [Candidatus Eremiobacteraeota bacterium]
MDVRTHPEEALALNAALAVPRKRDWRAALAGLFELDSHNARLTPMEGMRGIAILLVFVCHYNGIVGEPIKLAGSIAHVSRLIGLFGASGVDLFFVLSGFLIYQAALKPKLNYGRFMRRRAERIYPTFLAIFAVYIVLMGLHIGPSKLPHGAPNVARYLVANLLLLPGIFNIPAIIAAAWSLSYEFSFYIALPLVTITLALNRWRRRDRIIFFAFIAIAYIAACEALPHAAPRYEAAWSGSHVRMVMFVAGILVYELLHVESFVAAITRRVEWLLLALTFAGVAAVFAILIIAARYGTAREGDLPVQVALLQVVPVFVGYLAFGLLGLRPLGLAGSFLEQPWLRWTGNMSYSFYLVHSIPMHFITLVLLRLTFVKTHVVATYLLALPITLAITYVCSGVVFAYVEKPLSLRPRRLARKRQGVVTA